MKFLREQKGFTLIELAIVMVIIGIILGAVLKGQDLIQNARSKKFVTWAREWETSQWTYFDRKGRFAGDAGKDGIIGNNNGGSAEQTAGSTTALGEIANANFSSTPSATINFGSTTFYMKMGYDSTTNNRNIMVICATDTCGAFTADQLSYLESMDTAIDGIADRGAGKVRSASAVTLAGGNEVVTAATELAAAGAWAAGDVALVYYFDR